MPNNTNAGSGKGGTITEEDFESLEAMVGAHTSRLIAQKVAKVLTKRAAIYKHEYSNSSMAQALASVAGKITSAVGTEQRGLVITRDFYTGLSGMVDKYGPEVVIQKVAKLAKRAGQTSDASTLKALFPKAGN
jgi:hypothetical protein